MKTVFFCCWISMSVLAQKKTNPVLKDTVLLMNGVVIPCHITDSALYGAAFEVYNKKGKKERVLIDGERVYSLKFENGHEKIIYRPNLAEDDFTIEEARYFIMGEQDAERGFKSPVATIGGGVVGLVSGSFGSLLSVLPPFAYSSFLLLPKVKVKKNTVRNEKLLQSDAYLLGYERVARKKKVLNSFKAGLAGLAAGFIVNSIVTK